MLPFRCKRPKQFIDEPTIYGELAKRRNALWGELLDRVGEVADALIAQPQAPAMNLRMADFAAFGWRVFKHQGEAQAQQWLELLSSLEKAQDIIRRRR